jgi:hypothetical protein
MHQVKRLANQKSDNPWFCSACITESKTNENPDVSDGSDYDTPTVTSPGNSGKK